MAGSEMSADTAQAMWVEYERQLYPAALSAGYERTLTIVRSLADSLRDVDSMDELVARWSKADSLLAQTAEASGLSIESLPRHLIAGSAFAIRHREIKAERERRARRDRIVAAHRAGAQWIMLDESGSIGAGFLAPYRCCEMHLATGLAIVAATQPDSISGAPVYVTNVIKLDPSSGELVDISPGDETECEHSDPAAFAANRAILRERLASMPFDTA